MNLIILKAADFNYHYVFFAHQNAIKGPNRQQALGEGCLLRNAFAIKAGSRDYRCGQESCQQAL